MIPVQERLQLPATPPPARRPGLPVVALVAPVAMSVALWVMTGSPYALVLAIFGPLIALVGWLEARRTRRRDRRAAVRETLRRIDDLHARVDTRFDERRAALIRQSNARRDDGSAAVVLRVGTGPTPSGIVVGGDDAAPPEADLVAAIQRLRSHAATIPDAPLLLTEAEPVIVVDGPAALVRSLARSLVMQVLTALPDDSATVHLPEGEWWARDLPFELRSGPNWEVVQGGRRLLRVERGVAAGPGATVIRATDSLPPRIVAPAHVEPVRLSLMCAAEAAARARALAARAREAGWRSVSEVPRTVAFGSLPQPGGHDPLAAIVGVDARGPAVFDLDRDGPHALIAGTTGSGKSELLVTWVLALARAHAPADLSFLLIDFKGGASFAPVRRLPHVVGMVSDLDPVSAGRAVASLRAELLRREEVLATHGVRSLSELPPGVLARLVIVVDEYAALVAVDPTLQTVFADLAARGRTLGLHVILCTQRPAGVVRESVLANVTLRVCLRVLDAADSVAVVGHPGAAQIPADARGRGLRAGTSAGDPIQFALTTPGDVEVVCQRWATAPPATGRPWLDPLPVRLTADLTALLPAPSGVSGAVVGAVDLPELQRQEQLIVDPWGSGSVLVVGATGSGRSTALEMLAQATDAHVRRVPGDPAELWQALTVPAEEGRVLVVADDLDRTLAWADPDVRADLAELISRAARDTRRSGIALAASTRSTGGAMHAVQGAFEQRLVLRLASREEHLLAGAELAGYRSDRRAGSCVWAGREAQISLPSGQRHETWRAALPSVDLAEPWAVVTGRPDERARLRARHETTINDVDGWLADHGGLERARRSGRLLLVGCTTADHRALTRARAPLPPLSGDDEAWRFDGTSTTRVRVLPAAGQASPSGDSSAVKP